MKRILFVIFGVFTLCSCSNKNKIPPEIVPAKEMSEIMWDMVRAQALAIENSRKDSSINVESQTKALANKVFEIHHITSSYFDKSYEWYSSRPDIFRLMFDSLYAQKQRENDLKIKERYNHFGKDSLLGKLKKK